jgi:hypothetical protein
MSDKGYFSLQDLSRHFRQRRFYANRSDTQERNRESLMSPLPCMDRLAGPRGSSKIAICASRHRHGSMNMAGSLGSW